MGMCTEESYPYKAANGICKASSCTVGIPEGGVTGFKDVTPDDTNALMEAVAQQPVSIAIEADKMVFRLAAFAENYMYIEAENAKGHSYELGINEFADMTSDEFALTHLGLTPPENLWGDLPHLGTHTYS